MTLVKSLSKTRGRNAITAIAIDRDKNSQFAVKWAVDNLLNNDHSECVFVHVRNRNSNPEDFDSSFNGGRPSNKDEFRNLFLPYQGFCARKGIMAKEVVLHDIDVSSALICYAINNSVDNIVVGTSSRNLLTRKFRTLDVPSSLLKFAPDSCAVYVISSKGKVQSTRSANQPHTPAANDLTHKQQPQQKLSSILQPDSAKSVEMSRSVFSCNSWRSEATDGSYSGMEASQMATYSQSKSNFPTVSPRISIDSNMQGSFNSKSSSDISEFSVPMSYRSDDTSEDIDFSYASNSSKNLCSQTPKDLEAEIKKLRLELKQSVEMYNSVTKEANSARGRAMELQQRKKEEARKLEEARLAEEAALALVEVERQKTKAAMEAAQMAQRLVDLETRKREIAEMKATQEAKEKRRAMEALAYNNVRYRKYTIEEIETATDYFSDFLKIGEGGYGPVYRAMLDHTPVAIKVLRPDISQGLKQFKQEVEVLGSMRHPNMVILLGACPRYGCLVYEYMENGSLEDRLFRKDNTPPIPWRIRFKIAAEITTALLFLHQNKPEPLVHRDLKPANILLDQNYVSKIGDVGLARLVPPSAADSVTQYHMTAAAGTFCYIDPEYQQTGKLGVKSDLYSLGVMLLQMITAKSPMGLSHMVEKAIGKGTFSELLDPTVTDWPVEEALSFAKLALQCCELRKRDRPDLASVVLPELIRLRDLGSETADSNNDNTFLALGPCNSIPDLKTTHEINMRRGWQRIKSMTRKWGCNANARKSRTLPPRPKEVKKPDKPEFEGCWSFVGCSPTNLVSCAPYASNRLKRFKSFT